MKEMKPMMINRDHILKANNSPIISCKNITNTKQIIIKLKMKIINSMILRIIKER